MDMNVEALQRIALALEFDGRPFHGWQQQDHVRTVQGCLQEALAAVEGREVCSMAAGRTDAGVHAEALLVHADVCAARWQRSPLAYLHGCNSRLPDEIRVIGVRAVDADFHARFACRGRAYRYQIWNRSSASALQRWRHWWMPRALDVELMQAAAVHCLGRHDFSALRAAGCQAANAEKHIRSLEIKRDGHCIHIHVAADAFLYHMVRNLVGNLVEVGAGKRSPEDFALLLASRNRQLGAATAPAHGLYFIDALYDDFCSRDLIGVSRGAGDARA
ncbi:MAG: tRNA pseudouridine(38-40) synthase TruA [Zetaproteobacteria bacterium CG12_big_fil_rev_8_21_14_0_65_54_13]|nr:MAG: tRNA pseudouridine(38-40) synthase TruA [Zetaproteobacteria bacterium CG23_combo_of_CG06-09_8_20_14_all_54_7]PIW48811.1 MAG: tRNA pseudouridine(38-40) synthase TruA [Zetaproteobacteria bacterium CG12_big_fil_rev_8_21_14_0_65_54_13]PIX54248.1 MAG: tRNA pseudouridine(38-40) synthase TruA [Zetaproteobacteria bacterium CG_4_10_14_3_um_filter_54_28]PJA27983.1 MAG: tRNA pseudouridine(38-40) synthase TruA [Zetaproteobacteria bacterium CG_4_9_14_3_um_filter_54_145]